MSCDRRCNAASAVLDACELLEQRGFPIDRDLVESALWDAVASGERGLLQDLVTWYETEPGR